MTKPDIAGVKAHDTAQAVADLQARMDALERAAKPWAMPLPNLADAMSRLEPKLDAAIFDNIESLYEDAPPDPYAAGYWIPHTGDECPVPDDRRDEYTYVLFPGDDAKDFGNPSPANQWEWGSSSVKSHWRYADPIAAKAAYEAWAVSNTRKTDITTDVQPAPEYPWHDHDGSDKCPVPKRRRNEKIEWENADGAVGITDNFAGLKWSKASGGSADITRWRYTQPDTRKAKWGPWVKNQAAWNAEPVLAQCEFHGGKYLRHRVRI